MVEQYKFQKLDVYQLALGYVDLVYEIGAQLPSTEQFNLRSQIQRAATSIVLNIAEGSTGQSNAEQNRFLGHAIRSYLETVACLDLIDRHAYVSKDDTVSVRKNGHQLFIKLIAFRNSLKS